MFFAPNEAPESPPADAHDAVRVAHEASWPGSEPRHARALSHCPLSRNVTSHTLLPQMASLRDELLDREADDVVAILEGDPERIDRDLAAMWNACVREGDHYRLIGTAILWCSQQTIALAVCRCVRTVVGRGPAEAHAALDVTEKWARGEATLKEVWRAQRAVADLAYRGDAIAEAVAEAAESAGDDELGFDDEALRSAAEAVSAVLRIRGDAARPAIVDEFRQTIPPPTLAAFEMAHAARNAP